MLQRYSCELGSLSKKVENGPVIIIARTHAHWKFSHFAVRCLAGARKHKAKHRFGSVQILSEHGFLLLYHDLSLHWLEVHAYIDKHPIILLICRHHLAQKYETYLVIWMVPSCRDDERVCVLALWSTFGGGGNIGWLYHACACLPLPLVITIHILSAY